MKRLTIAGLIAAAAAGTMAVVAAAQVVGPRAPFWPATTGMPAVIEWFSDLPWHQKLGTYAGNEIDEPLILPYDALGDAEKAYCATRPNLRPTASGTPAPIGLSEEDCMIELGVNSILGMLRTDTPYAPEDPRIKAAFECRDASLPCIEVKLELSMLWSRPVGPDVVLLPRPTGSPPPPDANGYYGGYIITDGTTYAPQMPWYMSHYCDAFFPENTDVNGPVCYGDYFSTFNDGFGLLPLPGEWPRTSAWSVFPYQPSPPAASNVCPSGDTKCTLVMAGFDLSQVPPPSQSAPKSLPDSLQYNKYNGFLLEWFNAALKAFPTDVGPAENLRHFPWSGNPVTWDEFYPHSASNPFLGQFEYTQTAPPNITGCDVTLNGPALTGCTTTAMVRASGYVYPRQCTLADLANGDATKLRHCGLNYELHHNGFLEQWPETDYWRNAASSALMTANQYGRTSFLFAGIPGMQMPVSFYRDPSSDSGLSIYEQSNNASIFSLFLPITNVDDNKNALVKRNYTDAEFYHTLLMSNHMEQDPQQFAEGIRGKVLWHDEYRTQTMYEAAVANPPSGQPFPTKKFAASFHADSAPAPFHNNTCDGCHVRNGSGVPINTDGTLDPALQEFMTADKYNPYPVPDYTFTGKIRPMKLVFFDLRRDTSRVDASRYSEPLAFSADVRARPPRGVQPDELYYSNKIMNFYGDSFHVTRAPYTYQWTFEPANPKRLVVSTPRRNAELDRIYEPQQIELERGSFVTDPNCRLVSPSPTKKPWPTSCEDIADKAIFAAIDGGEVGFLHLNGKRLGNLSAIEAIPNQSIIGFRQSQVAALGASIAGELVWNAGSRDGVNGKVHRNCRTNSLADCYIGRFGWIGDRVSLEDQVANAAFVEMNMISSQGYNQLYPGGKTMFPIRYKYPNCGAANKTCMESSGNADLTETDINRMAEYARWLGNPTRSDFQVSTKEVIAGEKIFRSVKCDTCHVIRKIDIVPEDTMLSKAFRDRLATRIAPASLVPAGGTSQAAASPFLSYIGTDLLMHDMGYLSQLADTTQSIRGADGVVLPAFQNYVQKFRTPPLKGLRFNRYVTEAHKNTKPPLAQIGAKYPPVTPACDFLLHDGRACDAIEAAFLHDGPAIKKLGVIDALNALSSTQMRDLRAFLYSL